MSEVPRVGRFYAAGGWRVYRLTKTKSIEEDLDNLLSIPNRHNSCSSWRAAAMSAGRLRQLASTAIVQSTMKEHDREMIPATAAVAVAVSKVSCLCGVLTRSRSENLSLRDLMMCNVQKNVHYTSIEQTKLFSGGVPDERK